MKRNIAHISANGSIIWRVDWQDIDVETIVKVQMLAEDIARVQSEKAFEEAQNMAKWTFSAHDNGGKHQVFTVKAASKTEAIKKGMERAKKHAAGDINAWDRRLVSPFC